ncbi:MFS transporter [Paenibacillus durus]|nr:MFS transporter [Paenibacillus durus]
MLIGAPIVIIGDLVPPRERSRYQGLTGLVPAIALIAGPFLGGFISDYTSWRWVFFINLPIGVIAQLLIVMRMQLPKGSNNSSIDWLGGIFAAVSTTALLDDRHHDYFRNVWSTHSQNRTL